MAIIQGNAKQGSTRGFYPKVINGSLRFNDDDSAYLSWTPASAGNRKTWTYSFWVKRGNLGTNQYFLDQTTGGSDSTYAHLHWYGSTDKIRLSGWTVAVTTDAVFRDPSAWYHVVFVVDTTEATDSDRVKIYVNGVQQSTSGTYYGLNDDTPINATSLHRIGGNGNLDGYLANVHFIDGQALTASDFGETKNGVWVAKDYAGTFGTNGFYLTFEDDTQVEAFNTVLYRGNGGTQSITGTGFTPDLVWIKERTSTSGHVVFDQVRGATKSLFPDNTGAESTTTTQLTSFDSDGFTTGSSGGTNESGQNYVAWCWKAGDSNVSNTVGTITSTVRANDTYGFSIVSYTGNGTAGATVGHGLSSAPDLVIYKNRIDSGTSGADNGNWIVQSTALGVNGFLNLNNTNAEGTDSGYFNSTRPSSSVLTIGSYNSVNGTSDNMIAYCWSETTGYSKFGSYTGDGTSDGSKSITCGFKPAWVMIRRTDSINNWIIHDNTRDVTNPTANELYANLSNGDSSGRLINLDDNGFSLPDSGAGVNASGGTYIYAAFADTREAAFWLDQSGNDNDWQPVNLDHNDTVADSPTNNFATWNPLDSVFTDSFSDGNLVCTTTANQLGGTVRATIGIPPNSGQYYWEVEYTSDTDATNDRMWVGILGTHESLDGSNFIADYASGYAYESRGFKGNNGTVVTGWGDTFTLGDVVGIAFDSSTGDLEFFKNGTSQGVAYTVNTDYTYAPVVGDSSGTVGITATANFGQQPFKYDPPA